jgi:hypothetical protein
MCEGETDYKHMYKNNMDILVSVIIPTYKRPKDAWKSNRFSFKSNLQKH